MTDLLAPREIRHRLEELAAVDELLEEHVAELRRLALEASRSGDEDLKGAVAALAGRVPDETPWAPAGVLGLDEARRTLRAARRGEPAPSAPVADFPAEDERFSPAGAPAPVLPPDDASVAEASLVDEAIASRRVAPDVEAARRPEKRKTPRRPGAHWRGRTARPGTPARPRVSPSAKRDDEGARGPIVVVRSRRRPELGSARVPLGPLVHFPVRALYLQALDRDGALSGRARRLLHALTDRSNDTLHSVYGHQATYADDMGRKVRTVRYAAKDAEEAGYLEVVRCKPYKRPDSGAWSRKWSNRYLFVVFAEDFPRLMRYFARFLRGLLQPPRAQASPPNAEPAPALGAPVSSPRLATRPVGSAAPPSSEPEEPAAP